MAQSLQSSSINQNGSLIAALPVDPVEAAQHANLRYVSDDEPGIRRRRCGRGFTYLDLRGQTIRKSETRERFSTLAIPPAWTEVWICADENGHIQATGRDDRGRKQYIYHPRWQEVRNQAKFNRLLLFGEALPQLRAQIDRDLRRHGLPRERVVAAVVRLLEETLIRVGNEQYARQNGSYGLTTLHTDHVEVTTTNLHFEFRGKSGQEHAVKMVAEVLGNTAAICRDYYIHPAVIDAYEEGALFDMFQEASEQSGDGTTTVVAPAKEEERQVEEQVVLHLLRHHLAQERE